jgi:hypothetical protein
MRRIVITTVTSLCVVSLAVISAADTLIMRDGTRVEGTVTGIAARTITFRHADGVWPRNCSRGGGKGAAIDGLVGAAGGAGAQVVTRGRDIQVPAETVLMFRLDKAVTLQAER